VAGLLWAVLSPLAQILVLTTVFSLVLRVHLSGFSGTPYAIMLAWGFFAWLSFQDGLIRSTTSLVDGGTLLRRMSLRPEVLVAQAVLSATAQQVLAFALLIVAMPLVGSTPASSLALCVIPLSIQVAFTLGAGWILGVLHVYFRDTAQIVGAVLQAWFYLSPIVYTVETAPEALRGFLYLNPFCGIIQGFRAFAIGEPVSWMALGWSAVCAAAALLIGSSVVARARAEIVDLV
jgi:lipopolysaccharide transport system permease protein